MFLDWADCIRSVSVIRNVAVVGLPKGGKNLPLGPRLPPGGVFGERAGHGHGLSRAGRCATPYVQFPVTTDWANRPSDFGRRKMRQAIVLDRQNHKQ